MRAVSYTHLVFAENAKKAAACIEDNIRFTKFGDRCRLINSDAITAIRTLDGKYTFDIIFMDPPYDKMLERDAVSYTHLSDDEAEEEK